MLLAHPVTESVGLGVAPAVVALGVSVLLWVVAVVLRSRASADQAVAEPSSGDLAPADASTGPDPLSRSQLVGRAVGAALLVLAVVAGRLGEPSQLETITTALVIGAGWPLLLMTSLVTDVWGRLAPFDGVARLLERVAGPTSRAAVPDMVLDRVAVGGALLITWWLTAYQPGLEPRVLGLALGVYALVTWAGCLAVGRERWLARAEILTVLFAALARARRHRSLTVPPQHLTALGVLLGGLVAAELRFSRWFVTDVARVGVLPFSEPATVLAYVVLVALGVLSVHGAVRWGRRLRAAGRVTAVLPFLVVGAGLSAAVERDRLWVSAQVLWSRLSDPLGTGLDLLGTADLVIRPWPYGVVPRLLLQLTLLVVPVLVGMVVALRTRDDRRAEPAVVLVSSWVVVAVLAAASL